ncbi:MAG TPA: hypothetical protein VFX17_00275 [Patescibacteria group bacterium]|nr:hypothetical protein [Patescibacteria group bacterium]
MPREFGYSPENPFPPEKLSPISPEDQKRAGESLEEFREEKRQNLLSQKKINREGQEDLYLDKADKSKKTLKTRHAGPVAKLKRGAKELSDKFNKPALKIKIEKKWDNEE